MNDIILQKYQIRKSNKEKSKFIDYIKDRLAQSGYDKDKDITIETKGRWIFKSRNIVVGNPEEAEVVLTAHYDTCSVLPFPNLMAPTNPFIFISFQLLLVVIIFLIAALIAFPVGLLFQSGLVAYFAFLFILIAIIVHMMFGYRNKHTANDNTSGIIVLTQLLGALPEEHRNKVCVVYFDNEEKGLLGSAFFAKRHKKTMKNKMIINLDCVGDGKNVVSMAKYKARKDSKYQLFVDSLTHVGETADVNYLTRKMKFMMFPSDQANFSNAIGVCALRKSPLGMYTARIHTPFDTKCREENVAFLVKGMQEFIEKIEQ